jgi:hypothetical protein
MCPAVLDPTSLPRWAPTMSRALQFWTLPPYRDGLQCYPVPCGSGPCLLAKMGSGVTACPAAPDLTSLLRRPPTLPRVLWLRASLPRQDRLQCYHVSRGLLWATGLEHKERPSYVARLTCFQGAWAIIDCKTCGQAAPLRHARRAARQHH